MVRRDEHRGVVVIGSGFGGALAAWPLVHAGVDVLMLERGGHVERGPWNWEGEGTILSTPTYLDAPAFDATTDRGTKERHQYACVGGPSVFYGGISLRYREEDFHPPAEIVGDSEAAWPWDYRTLAPWYDRAEAILGIAGRAGEDPTEPNRSTPYPAGPAELSEVSRRIAEAGRRLGLRPFRLPLAINHLETDERRGCIECATCDTFACAIEAKNDIEVRVLRRLRERGLELRPRSVVTRLLREGTRVVGMECRDATTGAVHTIHADHVILAGGALGTPHLLLASGLAEVNPAGGVIGRYLTRHCSGIVFGLHPWVSRFEGIFHKQIGFHDFYHGVDDARAPRGPLGSVQQTQTPDIGTIRGELGGVAAALLAPLARRITGLLTIAEDRPQKANHVKLSSDEVDRFGMPRLAVVHRYADRDLAARAYLARRARRIHREAGAIGWYTHTIDTFSHALGTVRMGVDPATSPLDGEGRFRGVEGLHISDGSALPTSAGVNPSLTISAHALRVGEVVRSELAARSIGGTA
ncbi:MAG: GMC family oxidoreductase [Longimicrobiales bacterium]|nr:GMC family oxidoreductase [Longimicrobiales bacterium]